MNKISFFFGGVLLFPLIWMWVRVFVFHEMSVIISNAAYLWLLVFLLNDFLESNTDKMDMVVQTDKNLKKDQCVQTEEVILSSIKSQEANEISEINSKVPKPEKVEKIVATEMHMMEAEFTEETTTAKVKTIPDSPPHPVPIIESFVYNASQVSLKFEDSDQPNQTKEIILSPIKSQETDKISEINSKVSKPEKVEKIFATKMHMMVAETTTAEVKTIPDSPPHPVPIMESFVYNASQASPKFKEVKSKKVKFLVPEDPNLFSDYGMLAKNDKVAEAYLQYIKEKHEKKKLSFIQRKLRKITKHFKKK